MVFQADGDGRASGRFYNFGADGLVAGEADNEVARGGARQVPNISFKREFGDSCGGDAGVVEDGNRGSKGVNTGAVFLTTVAVAPPIRGLVVKVVFGLVGIAVSFCFCES